eukprot:4685099-Pleurochrysis_carterae.AAC.2
MEEEGGGISAAATSRDAMRQPAKSSLVLQALSTLIQVRYADAALWSIPNTTAWPPVSAK